MQVLPNPRLKDHKLGKRALDIDHCCVEDLCAAIGSMAGEPGPLWKRVFFREIHNGGRVWCFQQLGSRRVADIMGAVAQRGLPREWAVRYRLPQTPSISASVFLV